MAANTTQTKAQKTAIGILSSLPTTNPTLKALQKSLPLLPPLPNLPNLQNLGNGLSSAMPTTIPAGAGVQNLNTSQNHMCEVSNARTTVFF